jgi:hypothetical protein
MAQLGDAVTRYHKLFEQDAYRNPVWAEQLQARMRQLHLTESGRILTPILRPHFILRRQFEALTRASAQLSEILERMAAIVFASPPLMSRLQMLPAEKMLAAIPCGAARFSMASAVEANAGDAASKNGPVILQGLDVCKPAGLAYANLLADLFLELPILNEFKRDRYKVSKLGDPKMLLKAIQIAWREFDGGRSKPAIAIVEMKREPGASLSEGHLLAEALHQQGANVRVVAPELLQYSGGKLCSGEFRIDVVFRRVLIRELLSRFELSHPLLEAYRQQSVCMINNFRCEFAQRRSFFDLLTDETVTVKLPAADRKLIRTAIPWTRILSARKTMYFDQIIDLLEFTLQHREDLTLLPLEDGTDQRIYIGKAMNSAAWDRAVRQALRTPYVVQKRPVAHTELFPVFQYGELKMKIAEVTVHPHLINGQMNDASAILHSCAEGSAAQLAVAPVLLLEEG